MKSIGKQSFLTKLLLATNILTVVLLVLIGVKENYPQKVANRFLTSSTGSFSPTQEWKDKVALYPLYQEQKNIVMFGSSLTAGVLWNELLNTEV